MRIRLSDERRDTVLAALKRLHSESFDEELSDFRAEALLDFFVKALGPPLYNQAVQDARAFVQGKLDELDREFYEPEGRLD